MNMKKYRITKYDPQYRDGQGRYSRNEWTSWCDIGGIFEDRVFTKYKASGIAWNASITEGTGKKRDAIIASLEHKEKYSVIIGEPYSMNVFKKIRFDAVFAREGKNDIGA